MWNYLVLWAVNDYPECGGGLHYQEIVESGNNGEGLRKTEEFVNELIKDEKVKILKVLKIYKELKINAVDVVRKYEIEEY